MKDILAYYPFEKRGLSEDYWSLAILLASTPVVINAVTSYLLYNDSRLLKYRKESLSNPETLLTIGAVKDLLDKIQKESGEETKKLGSVKYATVFDSLVRLWTLAISDPVATAMLGAAPIAGHSIGETVILRPLRQSIAKNLMLDAKERFQNELGETLQLMMYIQRGKLTMDRIRELSEPKRLALLTHLYVMTGKNYAKELGLDEKKAEQLLKRKRFTFEPAGVGMRFSESPDALASFYKAILDFPIKQIRTAGEHELLESSEKRASFEKSAFWGWVLVLASLALGIPFIIYRGAYQIGKTLAKYPFLTRQEQVVSAIKERFAPFEKEDLSKFIPPTKAYFAYLRQGLKEPNLVEQVYEPPSEDIPIGKEVKGTPSLDEEEAKELEEALKRRRSIKK